MKPFKASLIQRIYVHHYQFKKLWEHGSHARVAPAFAFAAVIVHFCIEEKEKKRSIISQEFHNSLEKVLGMLCDRMAADLKNFGKIAFNLMAKERYNHLLLMQGEGPSKTM